MSGLCPLRRGDRARRPSRYALIDARQRPELVAEHAAAGRKINELTRASKASWERAKEGFAKAYRDLAESYDKAAAEFKK